MFDAYYMTRQGWVHPNKMNEDDVPVAVIAYADAEQVKRLYDAWMFAEGEGARGRDIASLALREFASPTPPNCGAVLNIAGVPYPCEGPAGHACAHGNDDARAIWRES